VVRKLDLGTTRESALVASYEHGYEAFNRIRVNRILPDDVDVYNGEAPPPLHEYQSVRLEIKESGANRRLWGALDEFYHNHRPDDVAEQYEREAAVAEDYVVAFEGGCYAALKNEACRPYADLPWFDG